METQENLYTKDCIRTHSGKYLNVIVPTAEMFDIDDMAHALSNLPRFAGHTPFYYSPCGQYSCTLSVAQHCCNGHDWILAQGGTQEQALEFLVHERFEASGLGDISSPIKHQLNDVMQMEKGFDKATSPYYGVPFPMSALCKNVDRLMLEIEWDEVVLAGKPDYEVWFPHRAKREFLERYIAITCASSYNNVNPNAPFHADI